MDYASSMPASGPRCSLPTSDESHILPYEIILLIIEAFLESAQTELYTQPIWWSLDVTQHLPKELLLYYDEGCNSRQRYPDHDATRMNRSRRLRSISQLDRKSRSMVNQLFPRVAFYDRVRNNTHMIYSAARVRFAYTFPRVDMFAMSMHLCYDQRDFLSPPDRKSLELLRTIEHIPLQMDLIPLPGLFESLSSLKSIPLRIRTCTMRMFLSITEYGARCDSHDGLSLVNEWFNTCHFISAWRGTSPRKRRIRVFVNSYNRTWQSGDWPLAELFYDFQTAPVSRAQLPDPPLRMRSTCSIA
ncbi:hypothetical protein RB213_015247 [Colletotrichum asianum]